MTRIGLLSDTHGYLDPLIFDHFKDCDEIWHAGDFGTLSLVKELETFKPLRGVYGNIDGNDIKAKFPLTLHFKCENVQVMMQHIGGYPGKYATGVKKAIRAHHTQLFISGHSHILKVMFDSELDCLHMNPGAVGKHGWHQIRTAIRFEIDGRDIKNCNVIEFPGR